MRPCRHPHGYLVYALSCPSVNRQVATHPMPAPGDPAFFTQHPKPESLVVQVSISRVQPNSFPMTPPDSRNDLIFGKCVFSSVSLTLRSVNARSLLGRYTHAWTLLARSCRQCPRKFLPILFILSKMVRTLLSILSALD